MKENIPAREILLICFGVLFFINCQNAFAAFGLSVRPYEGGFNLDYGKINPSSGRINKEVTVNIASDIAKQYRLVQVLLEPLSTMQGSSIAQNNFLVYAIRGSNQSGTLNVEQEVPVGMNRQYIYTSNQGGLSDFFTLVYSLTIPADIQPGSYRGRISFTLEPIDSTQSPVSAFLNIFAEVEVESAVEVRTSLGTKDITLKPGKEDRGSCDVIVNIKGAFARQFRILQLVEEQPVSSEGEFLDWEAVKFIGTDAQKGMLINEPTPISSRQQILYTSSPRGEPDSFVISYSLGDLSKQRAGIYRSNVKYILEGVDFGSARLIDILKLEIENPRVFNLLVSPEMGGSIRFRDLQPNAPPKIQEVTFEVKSNIAKQYQVTQNTGSLLTSKEGKVIPKEYFTLRQESLDTKGALKSPDKTEVKEGQMVLFISDRLGSPDKFKVIYELTVPRDIHSGDYYTNFTYSVSEI
ncbi:MAG: hypothetical protein NT066_06415 [Candidatus Omnitrophica bacterium]|nr:hypothetical protein [Candidatus Omnitrophota bacterium]